ncbi:hypothetical protein Stsp01_53530 [Streptomyces sp. NBRC 13847]|nr:hypothetical protein Stsp01_53530 [Streptomyces sp. NBRC 13847]
MLVDGGEEGVLAGEVAVEQGPGDTGLFGDVLHQHVVIRACGEEPRRDSQELGAAIDGAESLAGRHAHRLLDMCLLAQPL